MSRFASTAKFPLLTCVILAGAAVAAFAVLQPSGDDIGNSQIQNIAKMAGWGVGPVIALLAFLLIGILNVFRRMLRLRSTKALDAPIVLIGILPFLILAWNLTGEPRYTPIARAIIDFAGRPLLWGTFAATAFVLLVWVLSLLSKKK